MKVARLTILLIGATSFIASAEETATSWRPKQEVVDTWHKKRANTHVDESKVPDYQLPDLLASADGKPIKTAQEWTEKQRPALLQLFREHVYGTRPDTPFTEIYAEVGRCPNGVPKFKGSPFR